MIGDVLQLFIVLFLKTRTIKIKIKTKKTKTLSKQNQLCPLKNQKLKRVSQNKATYYQSTLAIVISTLYRHMGKNNIVQRHYLGGPNILEDLLSAAPGVPYRSIHTDSAVSDCHRLPHLLKLEIPFQIFSVHLFHIWIIQMYCPFLKVKIVKSCGFTLLSFLISINAQHLNACLSEKWDFPWWKKKKYIFYDLSPRVLQSKPSPVILNNVAWLGYPQPSVI